ncbi:MAG: TonB-dependent receptor plug domain-containing protein [Opitutaceae bacterium]|nr:TonB-dependent receptor plug domain-containing protein [Opitutaceae bacterium]
MITILTRRLPRGFALLLGIPAALLAQAAPPTDSDPVKLDTFVVNTGKDSGYIAIDSLAGGRMSTPIKFTPSAMSSLTRTFLDDVGIEDIRDSLQWTLNVVPSDLNAGKSTPFNDWDYNFRGAGQSLQGGAGPTRNYFTFYQTADTYNVERVEFDRGPNSILFGVGTVGGVLSTYTKQPRVNKDFITTKFITDSEGSLRFEGDINHRFSDHFAARLNLLANEHHGWRDFDIDKQRAIDLALLYKLGDNTEIRLDTEYSEAKRSIVRSTAPEGVTRWDGTTVATWGSVPTTGVGTSLARMDGGATYLVWIPGQPALGLQNWNVGYRSNGIFLPMAPEAGWYPSTMTNGSLTIDGSKIPVMPSRDFTISPKDAIYRPKYRTATLWFTHRFSPNLEAAITGYHYQDSRDSRNYEGVGFQAVDVNRQLPTGQPNPNFGKKYGDFFLSQQNQDRGVDEIRAQLTYKLEGSLFGQAYRQTISVSAGHQEITWSARQFNAQVLNSGISNPGLNLVRTRIYEDDTHPTINLPSTINGAQVGYVSWPTHWFDFDEDYTLRHIAAFSHIRMLDDKLSVLVGARHDSYDHFKQEVISRTVGGPLASVSDGASGTTYSAGAIYYLGPIGFFANHSKNFDPIGPGKNPSLSGQPFGPSTGMGYDVGIRLSTKDGKYYATAGYYDSKSRDRITGAKIGFGNIWAQYFDARGEARDTVKTTLAYDDTEAVHLTGYEFEITANPTRNLRLQASFGLPEAEYTEALPGQRTYYAENYSAWNAAASLGNAAATNLRNALTNAQVLLDTNFQGRPRTGVVDYTANIFANYSFRDGGLQGFSIGAGLARTGRQYISLIRNEQYFRDARNTTTLALAYETKIGRTDARFAVNIGNVLGNDDPMIYSYDGGWRDTNGKAIPNGFTLPNPRIFKFSAQFTF